MGGFLKIIHRIYELAEKAALLIGAVILSLWAIRPSRSWLEGTLYFDAATISAITAFVVLLVYKTLVILHKKIDESIPTASTKMIPNGVNEVYPVLMGLVSEVNRTTRPGDELRRIQVLGLTLFTAWPSIEGWLRKPDMNGWKIELMCLDPAFIRKEESIFHAVWATDGEAKIAEITNYVRTKSAELKSRNIRLSLRQYADLPALHGFHIGRGEYLVSFAHWDDSGHLDRPFDFYEHFSDTINSLRTDLYIRLFRNWLDNAVRQSKTLVETASG